MDVLTIDYAALVGAAACAWWALRRTRYSGVALLAGGLGFFTSPLWYPWIHKQDIPLVAAPPPLPAAQIWAPLAFFVITLGIVEIGRFTKKAALPVALLALLLIFVKTASAPWCDAANASTAARAAIGFGISYFVLRAIAAVIEASRGLLDGASALDVAGFIAFPPILSLGPIERASAFFREARKPFEFIQTIGGAAAGLCRIGEGMFKFIIVGEIARKYAEPFASNSIAFENLAPGALLTGIFSYSIYLYVNFSGATDMAIGASRLFGIKVCENFDIPYARPNLTEFWRAWHASLSTWLRDYLFFPIGKRMPRSLAPFAAPLVVMGICGLWHGVTQPFLAWGILHGAGLAAHQAWLKLRRASAALDTISGSIPGRTVMTVFTVFYVTFTWIFFAAPDLQTAFVHVKLLMLDAANAPKLLGIAAAAAALWSFIPGLRDRLRSTAASERVTLLSQMALHWRYNVDLICILVVAARFLLTKTAPEGGFVYNSF
ncbi:MAG: MBOAT family protein [Planctomycetes bacterium]|nr:MBOAT family protein [Planctomycetota bacterium]